MQTLELKTENLIPLLQEQLASGATVGLGVTGTSMQPMLRNGKDSVLLRPVDAPKKGDILLCGHTHVAADEECDGFRYINPGSVSIPKENTGNGYIVFEKGSFVRKML